MTVPATVTLHFDFPEPQHRAISRLSSFHHPNEPANHWLFHDPCFKEECVARCGVLWSFNGVLEGDVAFVVVHSHSQGAA